MKLSSDLVREIKRVAVGVAVLCVIMVVVFALIGKFDWTVITGAVYGGFFAVFYFYLLAVSVMKLTSNITPTNEPEPEPDEKGKVPLSDEAKAAKKQMQLSYTGRLLFVGGVAVIGIIAPCFNSVAALLPILFPRIVISANNVIDRIRLKKGGEKNEEEHKGSGKPEDSALD